MVSAALRRGFRAIRAAGGQRGLVRDRVGERPDDDTGRGFAASAADPSDDRRDGLDVQAGQPACHLLVPVPEPGPGGAERLGQQGEPGLGAQNDLSAGRSANSASAAVWNGPSTARSALMALPGMVS